MVGGIGIQEELVRLYFDLLSQKVKDQYRGHQDYHLMLDSIDKRFPVVGGKVKVQKEDKNGNFYTVSYNLTVKDDLGNFLHGVEDMGGQCMKGEIVKKGFIFTCMECGEPFCRRHVKFVDRDYKKPLCRYGFTGRSGCYASYWKEYTDGGIKMIRERTDRLRAIREYTEEEKRLEAVEQGQALPDYREEERKAISPPPPRKKTGALSRFLYGDVHNIKCGNPKCGHRIILNNILCPSCRNVVNLDVDAPLVCPACGNSITQVSCPDCEATNTL